MILWTSRSDNVKTGNVPTGWVGTSRERSMDSCRAVSCPLLHQREGGEGGGENPLCYAQHGSPSFAHHSMLKARKRGKGYGLVAALANRSSDARMVRIGAIGDPAGSLSLIGATLQAAERVKAEGLSFVGYTHGWRQRIAKPLRRTLMASCDNLQDVDRAVKDGWRAAVVVPVGTQLPLTTEGGTRVVLCPAMKAPGKVTCNTCRLCDASKPGPAVAFTDHGATSPARRSKHA